MAASASLLDAEELPVDPASLLLACVLAGADDHLPALSLCRLGATCRTLQPLVRDAVDWRLSGPCDPIAFFEGVLARGRYDRLRRLTIQFCDELRDEHLALLPAGLSELSLDACHALTDAGVKAAVARCGRSLELFSLYWNNNTTDAAALAISLRCAQLRSLSLSGCKRIGNTGVLTLSTRCRRLLKLNLTRLPLVDDLALSTMVQANPALEELRLYAASQYNDQPLIQCAKSCAQLRVLDCTGLNFLTDASLVALSEHCHVLRELVLSWAIGLSDDGVCAVASRCPLEVLSLHGIRGVSERSLMALHEHCHSTLTALDVRGCLNIPVHEPGALRQLLPHLRVFAIAM